MRSVCTFAILCLLALPVAADTINGRVIAIADGDTLTILDEQKRERKIRLNGIDTPEIGQDFGQAAKKNLSTLVFSKEAAVIWNKTDRYGRIVGTVTVGTVDTGLEQIKAGLAWYFRKYESDVPEIERYLYAAAEAEAKAARLGLWQQSNPVAPWDWRADKERAPLAGNWNIRPPFRSETNPTPSHSRPSPARSHVYITGPRGGCYYINGNGNKTYVPHNYCR